MLPSRELEYRILKLILDRPDDVWRPFMLSQLATEVASPGWPELIAALKRLHKHGHLQLQKWVDRHGFIPYTGKEPDGEFFYRADFQLSIAPGGRPYFEELQQKGTDARSKVTAYLDTNIVSALAKADMPPPVRTALVSILELFSQQ